MNKFTLLLNDEMISKLLDAHLPSVPIKNLCIRREREQFDIETCLTIVDKYSTTIESLELARLETSYFEMKLTLANMVKLRKLELCDVKLITTPFRHVKLPMLESLSINFIAKCDCGRGNKCTAAERILKFFKFNSSIKKFQYTQAHSSHHVHRVSLQDFIDTVPNIKHLVIKGFVTNNRLLSASLLLEILDVDSLAFHENVQFLLEQNNLKTLRLKKLSSNHEPAAVLRTIYDMGLESFHLQGIPLIANYETQHVSKQLIICDQLWIESALEILKRAPCK
jgi:predicted protein tyrosine phosphatase